MLKFSPQRKAEVEEAAKHHYLQVSLPLERISTHMVTFADLHPHNFPLSRFLKTPSSMPE
jgi:hypothetical protein